MRAVAASNCCRFFAMAAPRKKIPAKWMVIGKLCRLDRHGKENGPQNSGGFHGADDQHELQGGAINDGDSDQREDDGDAHLLHEGPKDGVVLRNLKIAQHQDMLREQVGSHWLGPGFID